MPLETGSYINDLVVSNPPSTDGLGQVDDHLRLIKTVLRNSFPNITGPVNASHSVINGLDGRVSALEASDAENIKRDGSVKMTGRLSMDWHRIEQLSMPVWDYDAAPKIYVDDREAAARAYTDSEVSQKTGITFQGNLKQNISFTASPDAPSGGQNGDVHFQI